MNTPGEQESEQECQSGLFEEIQKRNDDSLVWGQQQWGKAVRLELEFESKATGFSNKLDTGFKKRRRMKVIPEILTQVSGRIGHIYGDVEDGAGKSLGRKLRSLF